MNEPTIKPPKITAERLYVLSVLHEGTVLGQATRDAAEEIDRLNAVISETANERDEARGAAVKANWAVERLHGLLREMKAAMLGYPMSMRALTPTALLRAIRDELREPEETPK